VLSAAFTSTTSCDFPTSTLRNSAHGPTRLLMGGTEVMISQSPQRTNKQTVPTRVGHCIPGAILLLCHASSAAARIEAPIEGHTQTNRDCPPELMLHHMLSTTHSIPRYSGLRNRHL
jgi:hypothetical protein